MKNIIITKKTNRKNISVEKNYVSEHIVKMLLLIFLGILLINFTSAYVQFFQEDYDYTNRTLLHSVVVYDDEYNDFVSGGEPFEFYFEYSVYVKDWNELNPDYSIEFCNYTIKQFPATSGTAQIVDNQTFTGNYRDAQYFLRMEDGDVVFFDIECKFNQSSSGLTIPANVEVVIPTAECQACQFYEWSLVDRDIQKAEQVGGSVVDIVDNIRSIINLNFEIWLALFWIVLILVAIHTTGLVFIGIIWLYAYLKGFVK